LRRLLDSFEKTIEAYRYVTAKLQGLLNTRDDDTDDANQRSVAEITAGFNEFSELMARHWSEVFPYLDDVDWVLLCRDALNAHRRWMSAVKTATDITSAEDCEAMLRRRKEAITNVVGVAYRIQTFLRQHQARADTALEKLDSDTRQAQGQVPKQPEHTPGKSRVSARFPAPEGLTWKEVTIAFVSNDSIRVSAHSKSKRFTFAEAGFKDGRKGDLPDTLWDILRVLARHGGEVDRGSKTSQKVKGQMKAAIKEIRKRLKALVGIADDPFYPYREKQAYVAKFTLCDESFTGPSDDLGRD
jgi:hypothetical protein